MPGQTLADYGKCPCGGVYQRKLVEITVTVKGERQTMTDVPQGACPDCGSVVYKAITLEEIEAFMRDRPLAPLG
ncbi:MAG: YgiT-type zinc finger protein [Gaiellaceae bacterium]